MPKKNKTEFLISIYLSLVIIGFIVFFVGMVKQSVALSLIGALCILFGCLVVLLNVDEISDYVASGILSALKEIEEDGIIIELDKCKRIASKRRRYRPGFLWANKCRKIRGRNFNGRTQSDGTGRNS